MVIGRERPEHGVAMWGVPSSGKTTFLAALSIALAQRDDDWKVIGADEASTNLLIRLTTSLSRDRKFPDATVGIESYRWILAGHVPKVTRRRWFGRKRHMQPVKIELNVIDASGEVFRPDNPDRTVRRDLIDNMERSRGIVFLFDPIREFTQGDAFDYTFAVLSQLAQRMIDSPEYAADGYLPHCVAVCITKFDEIRVLGTAENSDLLVIDDNDERAFPRVDDSDARELFSELCEVSRSGNAKLVLNNLEKHFRPDRVKYFVTSAIGFHIDHGAFNPDDYQNVVPDPDKPSLPRIRGTISPINVVEPMMWLAGKLDEDLGAGEP